MKTFLVTGASTGIGAACAMDLDRLGHRVYAGVRREEDGERLIASASSAASAAAASAAASSGTASSGATSSGSTSSGSASGRLVPLILDITDQAAIDAAAKRISEETGGSLDGLVNNAGVARGGPLEFLELDEWREQLDVNVIAQVAVTRAMIPMLREARGRIVFIGSIGGKVASMLMGPYNASKFAIEGIGEALRYELHPWGIKVAVVEPGAIRTEIWSKATETADRLEEAMPDEAVSLYSSHMTKLRKTLEMQTRNAIPAQKVADSVRHALLDPRPRPRYLVGRDARAMSAMARLLPDRARNAVVRRVAGP